MPRVTSSITWLLAIVAILTFALMSAAAPPVADQRSTLDVGAEPGDALDETAAAPNACPVFCSTDAFCNASCPTPQLCVNHRCLAF